MLVPVNLREMKEIIPTAYGSKATWLSWMIAEGYPVPDGFAIPACKSVKEIDKEALRLALHAFKIGGRYAVAIRSSATCEDSSNQSMAGHFSSFLGEFSFDEVLLRIDDVLRSLARHRAAAEKDRMGIIVQRLVNPDISGVLFSSSVLTASKMECMITFATGKGSEVVEGRRGDDAVLFEEDGEWRCELPERAAITRKQVRELANMAKSIERRLNRPMDIEWCIVGESVFLVQCRPITTLYPRPPLVFPIKEQNIHHVPSSLRSNKKIALRLEAERVGVHISNGFLATSSAEILDDVLSDISSLEFSAKASALSIVVLQPQAVAGKVWRKFCASKDIVGTVREAFDAALDASWIATIIIQEVYDANYTGVAKRLNDGFAIDIGRGHFVPKGVIDASSFLMDYQGNVTHANIVDQYKVLHIWGESTISETLEKSQSGIPPDCLRAIRRDLAPFLLDTGSVIEFGVIEFSETSWQVYLIDKIEERATEVPCSLNGFSEGIVSSGLVAGVLEKAEVPTEEEQSLSAHFHDSKRDCAQSDRSVILVSDRPDILLMNTISQYDPKRLGIVFRQATLLCHLSIVLREKNIPALRLGQQSVVSLNELATLDAQTLGLRPVERIIYHDKTVFVLPYVNPDTDGVAAAIGYADLYRRTHDHSCDAVVFGSLAQETRFVLDEFNVPYPLIVCTLPMQSSLVIVDTHHPNQLSDSLNLQRVIEVVDHHPGGDPNAFPNAVIDNQLVGAAATLIAERYQRQGMRPSGGIAGLLALAVVSNTLNFNAPSTHPRDRAAFDWLQQIVHIPPDIVEKMFLARSQLGLKSTAEILASDYKEFSSGKWRIGIAQVETMTPYELLSRKDLLEELEELGRSRNADFAFANIVDILQCKSVLVTSHREVKDFLHESHHLIFDEHTAIASRILLRKTDFVPNLGWFCERG